MNLLKGEKICLRAIEPEDASIMFKWENDTNYWHLSNTQIPFSKNIMAQYANSEHDIYAQNNSD